jgi:hypothetical protein
VRRRGKDATLIFDLCIIWKRPEESFFIPLGQNIIFIIEI